MLLEGAALSGALPGKAVMREGNDGSPWQQGRVCCSRAKDVSGMSKPRLVFSLQAGRRQYGYTASTEGGFSKSFSPSSSLNSSEEDLCAGVASSETPDSTAKLGDTHKLEAFIADLDQILKEI
ncbi:uncharacterized protein M6D78_014623 isoform 1-T1 [Vipera latastei]